MGQKERILLLNTQGLEFRAKNGEDPLDKALELNESEAARILRDLSRGGLTLLTRNLGEDAKIILDCVDIAVQERDGVDLYHQHVDDIRSFQDLERLAKKTVILEDLTGIILSSLDNPIISRVLTNVVVIPQLVESHSFAKVIRIAFDPEGVGLAMYVNGKLKTTFNPAGKRFLPDMSNAIDKEKNAEQRVGVMVPETANGITTLNEEVKFLETHRAFILKDFQLPEGSIDEAILKILLSHCEKSVQIPKADRERIVNQISTFVKKRLPIPLSITFATGLRAPNPLKFKQIENLPTYGWLYFVNFMMTINEKVKRKYLPGLRIIIFEEATLFGPMLGFTEQEVNQGLLASRKLFAAMGDPFEIYPLTPNMFPQDRVSKISVSVDDSRIYALVCSRSEMTSEAAMDPLYTNRQDRSYAEIRRLVGQDIWDDSKKTAESMARYLEYRKKARLFEEILGHPVAIDATVTDKEGRVVLDITSPAMFNHGMPVVRRDTKGLHKIIIVPEYRLQRGDIPNIQPVRIARAELLGQEAGTGYMTFLYEQR
ncbi:hypothetical protein HY388_00250 [Candidatus Daviesbacteria bacterium]|nr:hypothetical protein [Candidatus Daviesbacteria bacterium]